MWLNKKEAQEFMESLSDAEREQLFDAAKNPNLYRQIDDIVVPGQDLFSFLAEFMHEFAPEKSKEITHHQAAVFIKNWDDVRTARIRKRYTEVRDEIKDL